MVIETLDFHLHLTRRVDWEDFTSYNRRESFKTLYTLIIKINVKSSRIYTVKRFIRYSTYVETEMLNSFFPVDCMGVFHWRQMKLVEGRNIFLL